ncbi:long-chain-fatty-acid--CoA ligase [Alloalcanivorax xenomutans]|uniref:long-chain-fatty-acid--CoA ligase n=1 Tax=Alloalcanivorax xenomutans TaxID=1094342 RepID=UPI001F3A8D4E|nr:long-chain-fatty-acid--CoA ligase [Alloalcanivorax xenomutans]MCE7524848.1 long-chain-fatty-acid--CoA ligase [Alloalcanivorax xenomutans]
MYLTQGLHRAVQQAPERLATVDGERRRSYRELADRCARLAGGLTGLGVQAGDRVAILAANCDYHAEYFLGLWWMGAVANAVNTRWNVKEMAYSLNDSEAEILLVSDAFLPMVETLKARCPGLRHVLHLGSTPSTHADGPAGMIHYEDFLARATPVEDGRFGGDHLAVLLYTGGTTGFPKGVMLSHDNLWSCAITRLAESDPPDPFVTLLASPLFHTAGVAKFITQIVVGGTAVMMPSFRVEEVLATIEREKITDVILVPSMIQMLVDHPEVREYDLSSLTRVAYGASPISLAVLERALAVFPDAQFTHTYGMTEASPMITLNSWRNHRGEALSNGRIRSAGKATWGMEVRIVDEDDREVPRGTVGEVVARGDNVMLGYWNNPDATAETLRGGWLHTGDGGYMDEDGYIYIVDRMKDMIVSGGENVYCAEVENVLARHPAVASCAVIGIPHDTWGESVHAVVVTQSGVELSAEELTDFCRDDLAGYKCPRSVEFRDSLPLSGAGKVLKQELREPYWRGRSRRVS